MLVGYKEFKEWLEAGEDTVRGGIQGKVDLVQGLDDFGERPLEYISQDGLAPARWATADGYANTMLLVAIREYSSYENC